MSNKLFQGVIHQMKDAIDRVIGVIDETGVVISCSELVRIGEVRQGIREELNYAGEVVAVNGYTYRALSGGMKSDYIVFVEGEDKMAEKMSKLLAISLGNIKNLYDEKYDKGSFIKNIILDNILPSDIYIKSKELHFNTEESRVVFLIKFFGKTDMMPFEMLQNMFREKSQRMVKKSFCALETEYATPCLSILSLVPRTEMFLSCSALQMFTKMFILKFQAAMRF